MADNILSHFWIIVAVVAIVVTFFLISEKLKKFSKLFYTEGAEVVNLRERVVELEKEVKALRYTISVLLDRLSVETIVPTPTPVPVPDGLHVADFSRPVLLVYGDSKFGEGDRNAMRRAGVSFFRLVSGSLDDLRNELHRRRSDNRIYDVVHISAHGGEGQINLENGLVTGVQLSDVLSNVRCVFLGTCKNQTVADKLVGIVQYVVVVYEEIEDKDAVEFTYEFYKRYKTKMDIESAFVEAMRVMPHISEFVDLRKRS